MGAIGYDYKSKLIIVVRTLNAERYQKMLNDNGVIDDTRRHFCSHLFFQQDGAPAHRAKTTIEMLEKKIMLTLT
jgi:hypothetical protein